MKRIYFILIILICVLVVLFAGVKIIDITSTGKDFNNLGTTFYAKIKKINDYNQTTTLLVEGLSTNDINHKGEFSFNINNTKVMWKGTIISKSYLKEGMLISIGKYSSIQETYPARLVDVKEIIVLQDNINVK